MREFTKDVFVLTPGRVRIITVFRSWKFSGLLWLRIFCHLKSADCWLMEKILKSLSSAFIR